MLVAYGEYLRSGGATCDGWSRRWKRNWRNWRDTVVRVPCVLAPVFLCAASTGLIHTNFSHNSTVLSGRWPKYPIMIPTFCRKYLTFFFYSSCFTFCLDLMIRGIFYCIFIYLFYYPLPLYFFAFNHSAFFKFAYLFVRMIWPYIGRQTLICFVYFYMQYRLETTPQWTVKDRQFQGARHIWTGKEREFKEPLPMWAGWDRAFEQALQRWAGEGKEP